MTKPNSIEIQCKAHTTLQVAQPEMLHDVLIKELSDFATVLHHDEQQLTLQVDLGVLDSVIVDQSIQTTIASDSPANLHMLRESVNHYAEEHMGLPPLTWSDEEEIAAGTLPPNCRIATVVGAKWLGQRFIRITLQAEQLESYTSLGLHFRIGLPPTDRAPVWPHLSAKGKTLWPKGDDKLHTPAYTTVSVDLKRNQLTFDVFAHNKGQTCEWATGLVNGSETRTTILLSGPGGNWLPPRENLIIAGDETALPAIRRTLQAATADDNILAFVEMETVQDFEQTLAGIEDRVIPLVRSEGMSAKNALLNLDADTIAGHYIWFAGEKADASELRKVVSESWKVPNDQKYIAAYWSRDKATTSSDQ
ncbi:siderophore-interacting protein [Leucothrix sargassi]|nr:siderophore-interacting protein [Leucothrix sargassi]